MGSAEAIVGPSLVKNGRYCLLDYHAGATIVNFLQGILCQAIAEVLHKLHALMASSRRACMQGLLS